MGGWLILTILLTVIAPTATITLAVAATIGRLRRVRFTRMLAWTAAIFVAALTVARFNPLTLVQWHWDGWFGVFNIGGLRGILQGWLGSATRIVDAPTLTLPGAHLTPAKAVAMQLPLASTIGVLLASAAVGWSAYRRSTLAELEEARFDFTRPFGIVDLVRRTRSRHLILTGKAVNRRQDTVALGTGRFGHIINVPVRELQRTTFVFGRIRSGKTAAACSLITQAARGGALVINFKGEGDNVAPHYARFAKANNRIFKHFSLASKSGQTYIPPIEGLPAAAQQPACYDPLRHGNADSKAGMLQNSVDRDGDAAVYLRTAAEFTLIAYQVARITGYDVDRSGFQVLHDLCDIAVLKQRLLTKDPQGVPYFNPNDVAHQRIADRVEALDAQWRSKENTLRGAVASTRGLLSSYMNGSAAGPVLRPGPTRDADIDLVDAVTQGHVVVFSLPVQDYKDLSRTLGTLVLLDLQNAIATLRDKVRANGGVIPWQPFFLHIEEFGSAAPEAVLDVLNKAGDVNIYPVLSTQAWADLTRMAGGEEMAKSLLEQAGNVLPFAMATSDGAIVLSEMTREASKKYPRAKKEFAGGLFGLGLRAAETGQIEPTIERTRQATPGDIQRLAEHKKHDNRRASQDRIYECLWIASYDGGRVTHTYKAYANNWVEKVQGILCEPEATAQRFPGQVYTYNEPDHPLRVAPDEIHRASQAEHDIDPHEDLSDAFAGITPSAPTAPTGRAGRPRREGGGTPKPDPTNPNPAPPAPTPPAPSNPETTRPAINDLPIRKPAGQRRTNTTTPDQPPPPDPHNTGVVDPYQDVTNNPNSRQPHPRTAQPTASDIPNPPPTRWDERPTPIPDPPTNDPPATTSTSTDIPNKMRHTEPGSTTQPQPRTANPHTPRKEAGPHTPANTGPQTAQGIDTDPHVGQTDPFAI